MNTKGIELSWIVVSDLEKAIQYFTEVVGLSVSSKAPEFGWAELKGPDGAILGIATNSEQSPIQPGQNAIVTISVSDIEKARESLKQKNAKLLGEIMEVPGHVKLQLFEDQDGNKFQLVEGLSE